jgi:hypothetical protein
MCRFKQRKKVAGALVIDEGDGRVGSLPAERGNRYNKSSNSNDRSTLLEMNPSTLNDGPTCQ